MGRLVESASTGGLIVRVLTIDWQICKPRFRLGFPCLLGGFTSWDHLRSYQDGHWLVRVHSWWLYSAVPRGGENQATSTLTWFLTQSHYRDVLSLVMQNVRLISEKYKFCKPPVWLNWDSTSRPSRWKDCTLTKSASVPSPLREVVSQWFLKPLQTRY